MILCTYEDRPRVALGLKLLLASLARFSPGLGLVVYTRQAQSGEFGFVAEHPQGELRRMPAENLSGWAVKPVVLLDMLKDHEEPIWIDTDIILTGDIRELIQGRPAESLIVTEQPWFEQESVDKTKPWRLEPGRLMPSVNSGLIRVRESHRELLQDWLRLLDSDEFRAAQSLPWYERPAHALSDQDLLHALLCSTGHSRVDVQYLVAGRDIAQCFLEDGYTVSERLWSLFRGSPPLVHGMGPKPWERRPRRPLYLDVSLYSYAARPFRAALDGDDAGWLYPHTALGKALDFFLSWNPALAGLPPAFAKGVIRRVRWRSRWRALKRRGGSPEPRA